MRAPTICWLRPDVYTQEGKLCDKCKRVCPYNDNNRKEITLGENMTASEVRRRMDEAWPKLEIDIKTSLDAVHKKYCAPLLDKVLRESLRHQGISYRKFMFNKIEVKTK